ncbi:MAG: hypothetical protein SVY15_00650 [Halobacteriota archaeon]|nr:hypothetical protein [Halobacteriota archaeon]
MGQGKRKVRKITEYIGSIDRDGVFTKKRLRSHIQESGHEIFEYGNSMLARYLLKDIGDLPSEKTPY